MWWLTQYQQGSSAGCRQAQAGTDRQGQVGSSPCPAASFPAGTEHGMWGWSSGIVLGSGWEVCCFVGSTGSHSTTLGIVLWETIACASLCGSNQVKIKAYSWESKIKRSPKLIVVVLAKKQSKSPCRHSSKTQSHLGVNEGEGGTLAWEVLP